MPVERAKWPGAPAKRLPARHRLTRADLPAELIPETLRHLGFGTLRELAHPANGILDAQEQQQFDAALTELRRGATSLADESLERARCGEPGNLDPDMRRSYPHMQQRLAEQAERARMRFPELTVGPGSGAAEAPVTDTAPATEKTIDDDVSPDTLEQQVEQTSETLDLLDRIATLQQQQLEHQERQLLSETRGLFFAFLVSVTVIVAGVAPLVEAEPHDRLLIVLWTVAAIAVAGLAYAIVRAVQARRRSA